MALKTLIAPIGVCIYIILFAIPFKKDIPLIILSLTSLSASILLPIESYKNRIPIVLPVIIYLIITLISILMSENTARSFYLSSALLPGVMLFFLISFYFSSKKHIYSLYLLFAIVGICLACMLIWTISQIDVRIPTTWMMNVKSPIFVVPNDVTFLVLLTPFSISLLFLEKSIIIKATAIISIMMCVGVAVIFQSRIAILTFFTIIISFVAILKPRLCIASFCAMIISILICDGFAGFPLVMKFTRVQDQRIAIWLSGLAMFKDSPLFGHGPRTFGLLYQDYLGNLNLSSWFLNDSRISPWAHNIYIETLAEQGIIGIIAFLSILISTFHISWQTQRKCHNDVNVLCIGAFAVLTGFCIAAFFELTLLRQWVVMIFFTILGIISNLSLISKNKEAYK